MFLVVVDKESLKFADGFYGWDSGLHSQHQIFGLDELPYEPNDEMYFIVVGRGNVKPSVESAQTVLYSTRKQARA